MAIHLGIFISVQIYDAYLHQHSDLSPLLFQTLTMLRYVLLTLIFDLDPGHTIVFHWWQSCQPSRIIRERPACGMNLPVSCTSHQGAHHLHHPPGWKF